MGDLIAQTLDLGAVGGWGVGWGAGCGWGGMRQRSAGWRSLRGASALTPRKATRSRSESPSAPPRTAASLKPQHSRPIASCRPPRARGAPKQPLARGRGRDDGGVDARGRHVVGILRLELLLHGARVLRRGAGGGCVQQRRARDSRARALRRRRAQPREGGEALARQQHGAGQEEGGAGGGGGVVEGGSRSAWGSWPPRGRVGRQRGICGEEARGLRLPRLKSHDIPASSLSEPAEAINNTRLPAASTAAAASAALTTRSLPPAPPARSLHPAASPLPA